jgi:hypothetical protein
MNPLNTVSPVAPDKSWDSTSIRALLFPFLLVISQVCIGHYAVQLQNLSRELMLHHRKQYSHCGCCENMQNIYGISAFVRLTSGEDEYVWVRKVM